jgi:[protein-PII] uridylyltransferase
VFFITDADNHPLSDPQLCARLQEAIVQQLQAGQSSDANPARVNF